LDQHPEEVRFASDSPLGGNGFELPVPREISSGFEALAEFRPTGGATVSSAQSSVSANI
jgi:hypothetical protein